LFISHVEEDAKVATEIANGLERSGFKTWYYERDSVPGQSYLLIRGQAIEQSQVVILIISPHSLHSHQVQTEIITAYESGKTFIPVLNGISHPDFLKCQPDWRRMIGPATSIFVPTQGPAAIIPRILSGLESLHIEKSESWQRNKYRVFISYSHDDLILVQRIVEIINENGLFPMWDKDFLFGHGFQDSIKTFIAHSHVFLPVITESSSKRGWVHQEIGYAMALNVPVFPLALGTLPGEMIRELHAVQLDSNLCDLKEKLSKKNLTNLICDYRKSSLALFQCAEHEEDRTMMMTKYANEVLQLESVLQLEAFGCVRQKGGLSSFQLPDQPIADPIWKKIFGVEKQGEYYCNLLREERKVLERHARVSGCRIIINPYLRYEKYGEEARITRLENLAKFIDGMHRTKIQIAINPNIESENSIIVGDWFAAESGAPQVGIGVSQTNFTRHAPSIQNKVESFEDEFVHLLENLNWSPKTSRDSARQLIQELIENPPVKDQSSPTKFSSKRGILDRFKRKNS
jgi:hypothetical protein